MADRTVTVKLVIDTSDVASSLAEIGRGFGGGGGGRRGYGGGGGRQFGGFRDDGGGSGGTGGGGSGGGGSSPYGGVNGGAGWGNDPTQDGYMRAYRYRLREEKKKQTEKEIEDLKADRIEQEGYAKAARFRIREERRRIEEDKKADAAAERIRIREEAQLDRQALTTWEKQVAKRDAARHGLGIQALGFAGMGGIEGHYGQMQLLGQHLGTLGEAAGGWGGSAMMGAGAMVSRAALPVAVAVEAERLYREHTKLAQNPYLSDTQRQIQFAEKLPFGSTVMDMAKTYSGYNQQLALSLNEINPKWMLAKERQIEMRSIGFNFDQEKRRAQMAANVMSDYGAVGLPTGDRFSAFGRREYAETSRLQNPTQQLELAQRQLTIATRNRAITAEDLFKTEVDLKKAQKAQADAVWRLKNLDGNDIERANQVGDAERWSRDVGDLQARQKQLIEKANAGAKEQDAARHQLDMARIGVAEAKLANTRNRADTAESHYLSLAYMGPGGRAIAENAYNLVKQSGVMDMDPSVVAHARSFKPQEVDAIALREIANSDIVKRNKDSVDFPDLKALREQENEQVKALAGQKAEAEAAVTQRQAETLSGAVAAGIDKLLKVVIEDFNKKVADLEVALRGNQIKR